MQIPEMNNTCVLIVQFGQEDDKIRKTSNKNQAPKAKQFKNEESLNKYCDAHK